MGYDRQFCVIPLQNVAIVTAANSPCLEQAHQEISGLTKSCVVMTLVVYPQSATKVATTGKQNKSGNPPGDYANLGGLPNLFGELPQQVEDSQRFSIITRTL